jgi:branched-chain amino acid transport system ATP-binding protein
MVLQTDSLVAGYGTSEILHGISLSAGPEGLAVLGPNGAGKTTLLRVLSGLLQPRAGTVTLNGVSTGSLPPERIVGMGMVHVPQGRRIFGSMTVRENLQLGAYLTKDRRRVRQRLDEIYDIFPRLRIAADRSASQMSGGEQQMLAIARALMIPATVILLDEPSDGLAPMIIEELADLLVGIQAHFPVSLVLVEQNPWLATKVTERCIVLAEGLIVAQGETQQIAVPERLKELYLSA